jgi:glutamyl-tRNA synthetase
MNGYYIRQLDVDDLAERLVPFLVQEGLPVTVDALTPIVPLIQERLKTLTEAVNWIDFFFLEKLDYDPQMLVGKKMTTADSLAALKQARETLASLTDFQVETTEPPLRALAADLGLKAGQMFGMVRVAVTGKTVAPPLFETMAILGQPRTMARLDRAIEALAYLTEQRA